MDRNEGAWTAGRCQRLLRPLTSKLALLRKERQLQRRKRDASSSCKERLKESDTSSVSSFTSRKRLKRTYSAKAENGLGLIRPVEERQKRQCQMQWQPSPTLGDRIRLYYPDRVELGKHRRFVANGDRSQEHHETLKVSAKSFTSDAPLYPSQRYITPESWVLVKGLYCGLHALLIATAKEPVRVGAKSLFSTCLRKVPEYIIKEQKKADLDNPEHHTDISALTYDDLEAFGSVSDCGWKPLREVVRAHGIQLFSDAIRDGLIDHARARGLAVICMKNEAYLEAEVIVHAMLSTMKSLPSSPKREPELFELTERPALFTLHELHGVSKRCRFFYAQLARLFSEGILPIEWVSSRDLIKYWNLALISVGANDQYTAEALILLRSVMLLELRNRYRRFDGKVTNDSTTAVQRTVDKLLRILVANAIMTEHQGSAVQSLMLEVLALPSTRSSLPDTGFGITSRNVIMAAILCTGTLPQDRAYLSVFSSRDKGMKAAASFVCSVARCCWLANHTQSFDYIQRSIENLSQNQLPSIGETGVLLADVAITAAFEFSDTTHDAEHLEWATALENRLQKHGSETQRRTPSRLKAENNIQSGLRWEEGISEWVAKTPRNEPMGGPAHKFSVDISTNDDIEKDKYLIYSAYNKTQEHNPHEDDPHLQALSPCDTKLNRKKTRSAMGTRTLLKDETSAQGHLESEDELSGFDNFGR